MFSSRSSHWLILLAAWTLPLALAACGAGATPQLIGSYPKGIDANATAAGYAPAPANLLVVYNEYLELEVPNTDTAADLATQLAYEYGGYLVSSQSWYQDNRKYTTLTLAVPVAQFTSMRQSLLGLGSLISENVSGDLVSAGQGSNGWNTFSSITLRLRPMPTSIALPRLAPSGWDPTRTFARAFGVFASIFTFLIDVVIWVIVIVGPFVLIGLGARALVRRMRRP